MFRSLTKKRTVVALSALLVLALAGGAVAYFSSSGSGSGSASVGTSTAFQIAGTSAGALYPGQSSTVTFSVTNPGGGSQQLATISLTGVKACSGAGSTWNAGTSTCSSGGTEATTCETSSQTASSASADFSMANVVENQAIPAGATYGSGGSGSLTTGTGTLTMNNLNSSQDACKGVSLYLQFSS